MFSSTTLFLGLALPLAGVHAPASGETITVTTLHDVRDFGGAQRIADLPGPDGLVSFGEAVAAANNEPGPQTIHFAIPRSEYWLVKELALLELELGPFLLTDDATTIDFRTQTAFAGDTNPNGWEVGIFGLEPNGWGVAAIIVAADDCTVIGLDDVWQRGHGVELTGNRNRVLSCTTNGGWGSAIHIEGTFGFSAASQNVIGGTGPGEGNIVSGISIAAPADDNVVIGNTCLGAGISVVAAPRYGVSAHRNRIGGPTPAERNRVAGSGGFGEEGFPLGTQIRVDDADDTIVEGNYVGTTADGQAFFEPRKGTVGIGVTNARGTLVRGNLVSGMLMIGVNHFQGQRFGTAIEISGRCEDTLVVGNLVGVTANGQDPLPGVFGIVVEPFTFSDLPLRTSIGGTTGAAGNTVAFSEQAGITVHALVDSVAIRGNRIFENGGLGIDLFGLAGGGVTPNDALDADVEGGNHLQNFPVLRGAMAAGSSLVITGRLDSTPATAFALDFFASPTRDPSGFGEGAEYLGSAQVATDASGRATILASLARSVPRGWFLTATATDLSLGETSEFAAAVRVTRALAVR